MPVEAHRRRLQDLEKRDEIARRTLGPAGERLKESFDREAVASGPTATTSGLFYVWEDYRTGAFENIENIQLRWVSGELAKQRLLEYTPHESAPFRFKTHDDRVITPKKFLTDGGTIPAFATVISGIDRFAYLPAYLIHDWEYVLKHCDQIGEVTQNQADTALMEALKTLMTTGQVSESKGDFWAIQKAIGLFAGAYWNADTPCSL